MSELQTLERLFPSENGLTVLDAETQETSYGICFFDGLPYIFDSHRKDGRYVATIELLTEVVTPIRVSTELVRRFSREARTHGLLPIPYTACFFKGNLHVYAFSGPVRGFDLATAGATVAESEQRLLQRTGSLWARIPGPIARAQRDLLEGRTRVRHVADLEVLIRRWRNETASGIARVGKPRIL